MPEVNMMTPPKPNNTLYFCAGLIFLLLSRVKNLIGGYRSPRTFSIHEIEKGVEYDFNVVNGWLRLIEEYTGNAEGFANKRVLELGPGADLGIAILTLLNGAEKYNSLDVNPLVRSVPKKFYEALLERIRKESNIDENMMKELRDQLKSTIEGTNKRVNYVCRDDFDILVFDEERIDIVVSQAAFEHFDDMEKTISQLSKVVTSGCVLISVIDLMTHSRWIRDVDPLNIYRYDSIIYNLLRCPGTPNRLRPYEYEAMLAKHGWSNIKSLTISTLDKSYVEQINASLSRRFRDPVNQMDYLGIALLAIKI